MNLNKLDITNKEINFFSHKLIINQVPQLSKQGSWGTLKTKENENMKITIEELEEIKDWMNSFADDSEYWEQQPQFTLPNYSDYIIYPKQRLIWSKKTNKVVGEY